MFRALIVDGDITQANLTARGIEQLHFGVRMRYALSAAQTILYLDGLRSAKQPLPDMIVVSAELRDARGPNFVATLRKLLAADSPPIVVVSRSADRELASRCFRLGASAFVPRPESTQQYHQGLADTVAFVGMLAGLVPRQPRFLPPEQRRELTVRDILQVHL